MSQGGEGWACTCDKLWHTSEEAVRNCQAKQRVEKLADAKRKRERNELRGNIALRNAILANGVLPWAEVARCGGVSVKIARDVWWLIWREHITRCASCCADRSRDQVRELERGEVMWTHSEKATQDIFEFVLRDWGLRTNDHRHSRVGGMPTEHVGHE